MLRRMLHALLILSLALNGSGAAMAASSHGAAQGVDAASQSHTQAAMMSMPRDDAPCAAHDSPVPASSSSHSIAVDAAAIDRPAIATHAAGDDCCGDSATCACACMQHMHALAGVARLLPAPPGRVEIAGMSGLAHAAPAQGERIRPPIA